MCARHHVVRKMGRGGRQEELGRRLAGMIEVAGLDQDATR